MSSSTNHLTGSGIQYDGAGNQLNYVEGSLSLSYSYGPFNQVLGLQGNGTDQLYVYSADDERVLSFEAEGDLSEWTIRGVDNKVLRIFEVDESSGEVWSIKQEYVYQAGQLLASDNPTDGTSYFYLDHLGTPRLIKDDAGTVLASHDYYPFGEELASGTDAEVMKFHESREGLQWLRSGR